jgi:heme exporter protein C
MVEKVRSRLDLILGIILALGMVLALYMAFGMRFLQFLHLFGAPRETTMGDLQRIFYFHVGAAIAGMTAFAVNFAASLMYVIRKNRRWDNLALAAAETGVVFLSMVLVTGPIWAKSVWFIWWTWSPRLTLSLVLCLLYVAYLLIRNYIEDPERRAMVSAVFGIIAFLDVPLVWFSIRLWRDIHPSAMLETGGLSPAMRPAFFVCFAAFEILMIYILRRRFYLEAMRVELERIERQADIRVEELR